MEQDNWQEDIQRAGGHVMHAVVGEAAVEDAAVAVAWPQVFVLLFCKHRSCIYYVRYKGDSHSAASICDIFGCSAISALFWK